LVPARLAIWARRLWQWSSHSDRQSLRATD